MAELEFSGIVTKVTADGRSAVITLDREVGGQDFAVISPDTKGRLEIMGQKGRLEEGTRIAGGGFPGIEALAATSVRRIPAELP